MRGPIPICFAFTFLVAASPVSATTYDTTPSWNGSSGVGPFGKPNNATFGQTFVAPADATLQSFRFYLSGAGVAQVQAQVFAWTGSLKGGSSPQGAHGPALYTSAPFAVGQTNGVFVPYTVPTGGLALIPGDDYVALFSVSGPDPDDYIKSSGGNFLFGYLGFSHVPNDGGGGAAFDDNSSDYASLTSLPWSDSSDLGDLAFAAVFSTGSPINLPEPGAFASLAAALFGFGALRYLSRRHRPDEGELTGA